jgi:pilus assembly protein CpaE
VSTRVTIVGATDSAIDERLRSASMQTASITAAGLDALAHPTATPPDILILDLRVQKEVPRGLQQVKRASPDTGLLIVASSLDPALMLEAMRAGVTECVTDIDHGELEAAIERLLSQRAAPVTGEVFVFVGAKGGVGTTTAAVNVATALCKFGSVLVIDLHLAGGDAALFLGADPHFTVVDALENTHRLDVPYFRGLLARTKAGPDLLASADRTASIQIDAARIRTLIDFAARHYRYTVIDVPRSDAAVLDSLENAALVTIVANQELATVRSAGRMAAALRQHYGKEKVAVVLSRSDRQAEIGQEDLQRAVGGAVKATFPSDYRLAVKALNHGQPIVTESKAPLATAFQDFAKDISGAAPKKQAGSDSKGSGGILGIFGSRK